MDAANPIDVESGQATPSGFTHATPSVTTTVANAMIVTAHSFSTANNWTPPAGMTEAFDVAATPAPQGGGQSIEANYALQATAGATGPKTATASGVAGDEDVGNTHILALRPVSVAVGQVFYIHTDHLNTPRRITNQSGQAVWRWDQTDPFGGNVPDENPSGLGSFTCNLRLPGQYFDKETNLHYNYFRDYDPATGRYPQADPLGITTTPRPTPTTRLNHLYAYVDGNPLSRTDRYGLQSTACCSYGTCYSKCIDDRLIDPTAYAYDLLALGAAYGVGATPFYGGIITGAELGGAYAGGYVGAYLGGAAGAAKGVAAGAAVGGGVLAGVGIAGAGLAGYAIGSAAYCAAVCASDNCYYR